MSFRVVILIPLIFLCEKAFSQAEKTMPLKKMAQLIPAKIKGFRQDGDTKTVLTKVGILTYALCERNFSSGNKSIKILLFDYNDAPIMYNQAMRKWNDQHEIETDTLIFRAIVLVNNNGWESYWSQNKKAQILLGIHGRFFLHITGINVDLDMVKSVVQQFSFDQFPKKENE